MNDEEHKHEVIRRILVALDASPHSLAALQAAAELAASLDAELLGVYVEDVNLLRLSDLPFARQVSVFSSSPRRLDRDEIERQLRSQARLARRALATVAERTRLRWSFRVAQGLIPVELLQAALDTDLIILGKAGWSRGRRLGSTARVIVAQAPRQALLLQQGSRLGLPIGVVYDGSPLSQKALLAASQLLHDREEYLLIVILAESFEQARALQSELAPWLRDRDLRARYRWLVEADADKLIEIIDVEGCGVLVLPGEGEVFSGDALADVINATNCPALLVR